MHPISRRANTDPDQVHGEYPPLFESDFFLKLLRYDLHHQAATEGVGCDEQLREQDSPVADAHSPIAVPGHWESLAVVSIRVSAPPHMQPICVGALWSLVPFCPHQ